MDDDEVSLYKGNNKSAKIGLLYFDGGTVKNPIKNP